MGLFWQITGGIATWTIRNKEAARMRIWGSKRHYMGLNLSVFCKTERFVGSDFKEMGSDDFTGVFS